MKRWFILLFGLVVLSCNNERVIQLPEIENAEITEVLDVSPAYIFYNENLPSSTDLNRNNLISTTNWLVNVDKRLSLDLVIPHIQYLQDKRKKASMHKNENAKNYFTCNDISIKNLGFVDFTDVNFINQEQFPTSSDNKCLILINSLIDANLSTEIAFNFEFSKFNIDSVIEHIKNEHSESVKIILLINSELTFQDYITIKDIVAPYKSLISKDEFFF